MRRTRFRGVFDVNVGRSGRNSGPKAVWESAQGGLTGCRTLVWALPCAHCALSPSLRALHHVLAAAWRFFVPLRVANRGREGARASTH
jgi:hypothetical protein